jgi:transposase, IS5 family
LQRHRLCSLATQEMLMNRLPGIVVACAGGVSARNRSASTTQPTSPDGDFETYRKPTRRDGFLMEMQALLPWAKLVALVDPHFPQVAGGRRHVVLECMLRIFLLQHWFNLGDATCEEALYDSAALLAFSGVGLREIPVPDAGAIFEFRQRMEKCAVRDAVIAEVERTLDQHGLRVRKGTIVDAAAVQTRQSFQRPLVVNALQQPQGLRASVPGGTASVRPSLNFTAIGAFVALNAR